MKFNLEIFDVREVIADVVDNMRERISSRDQRLVVDVADEVPPIFADPNRISQVLANLISNAHKYTPDAGRISLLVKANDTHAEVAIADNGIGISAENQEKLFTQFFRAEDEVVREQPGWGLGLSIVRKMVEAQNGQIEFESEIGRGSTFTFTVPLANINNEPLNAGPSEEKNE